MAGFSGTNCGASEFRVVLKFLDRVILLSSVITTCFQDFPLQSLVPTFVRVCVTIHVPLVLFLFVLFCLFLYRFIFLLKFLSMFLSTFQFLSISLFHFILCSRAYFLFDAFNIAIPTSASHTIPFAVLVSAPAMYLSIFRTFFL